MKRHLRALDIDIESFACRIGRSEFNESVTAFFGACSDFGLSSAQFLVGFKIRIRYLANATGQREAGDGRPEARPVLHVEG